MRGRGAGRRGRESDAESAGRGGEAGRGGGLHLLWRHRLEDLGVPGELHVQHFLPVDVREGLLRWNELYLRRRRRRNTLAHGAPALALFK